MARSAFLLLKILVQELTVRGVQLAEAQEEAQEAASRTSQLQQARREAEQELARIQSEAEPVMAKAEQLQEQACLSPRIDAHSLSSTLCPSKQEDPARACVVCLQAEA